MLFQLPSYLLFIGAFLLLLTITPCQHKKTLTLIASILFYSFWNYQDTVLLLLLIAYTLLASSIIIRRPSFLVLFVVVSLLPLIYYKYRWFLLSMLGINDEGHVSHVLPLGISFITFTLISFMVDLKKKKQQSIDFLDISLYISFFPHLIAGPILRSYQLIPQLNNITFRFSNILDNIPLFAVGIMKKVMFADPLGRYVDIVYSSPTTHSSGDILLAIVAFAIQIYCDFSAYSDMAIASAAMLGISFPENFKSPYLSSSFTQVWQRWHMTLSFWIRDYIFLPLHHRFSKRLPYFAIIVSMLLSGLWHGANWTFVIWGGIQGVIMAVERATGYNKFIMQSNLTKYIGILMTFLIWTLLAVLFRSPNIETAVDIYQGLLPITFSHYSEGQYSLILIIIAVLALHKFDQVSTIKVALSKLPRAITIPIFCTAIVCCSLLALSRPQSFYYFDF